MKKIIIEVVSIRIAKKGMSTFTIQGSSLHALILFTCTCTAVGVPVYLVQHL